MKKIKLLGVTIDAVTEDEALKRIEQLLTDPHARQHRVVTPNPEILLHAQHDHYYKTVLNRAALSVPDGIGLLWASRFLHGSRGKSKLKAACYALFSLLIFPLIRRSPLLPQRVAGIDLMKKICGLCAEKNIPVFLLGAAAGVAQQVAAELRDLFPNLEICGAYHGSPHKEDFPVIKGFIDRTRPAVLFVAYGAPAQELWIAENLRELPSVKLAMGVGGAFDFIAEKTKRAPQFLQHIGFEWLHRVIREPWRIKRIFNATIRFPMTVIRDRLRN